MRQFFLQALFRTFGASVVRVDIPDKKGELKKFLMECGLFNKGRRKLSTATEIRLYANKNGCRRGHFGICGYPRFRRAGNRTIGFTKLAPRKHDTLTLQKDMPQEPEFTGR